MARIPKKLYFTYKTANPPELYRENLQCWHDICSDWQLHYFSDKQIYTFFETHFPQYRKDLPKISCGAVLADVFRYAVLYVHGGMYNDLDTFPLQKIPEKWLDYDAVVGYELQPSKYPQCSAALYGYQDAFCQWSLLSSPGYSLFKEALDVSFKKLRENDFNIRSVKDTLTMAGPLTFTELVRKYMERSEVLILDMDYFGSCRKNYPVTERSVVRHLFHGFEGWRRELDFPHLKFY